MISQLLSFFFLVENQSPTPTTYHIKTIDFLGPINSTLAEFLEFGFLQIRWVFVFQ